MKKFLAMLMLLAMCFSCAAMAETTDEDLAAAKTYLFMMYKDLPETTMSDYEVVGVINIGGIEFPITWTADSDTIKIVPQDNKMVTIDVDEKNPEEVTYTLTATLSNAAGETLSVSFAHKVPAAMILEGMSYEEIVAAAYSLEAGLALEDTQRLYGTVTKIDTPWSDEYKNITVTIQVGELADQPIQCFRLTGEGAKDLKEGDEITVEGILKNYQGTVEFDKGCVLVPVDSVASVKNVIAAYALAEDAAMTSESTITGVVVAIPTAWSDEYQNITVNMVAAGLEDYVIQCYRLTGEGAEKLQVGDAITVEGILKNYKGTIEFDKGCVLVGYGEIVSQKAIVDAAYSLESGVAMTAPTALVGEVVSIDSAWSDEYQNITVTIVCDGLTEQPIQCYRLSGEGAQALEVGSVVGVYGTIKNYKGTVEFDKGCVTVPADSVASVRLAVSAYALEAGLSMNDASTMTGVITSIDTAWSDEYKNITVTIVPGGLTDYAVQCYRLSGEGAETLAVGDTITVSGTIKNYKGTIEFDKGCTLDAVVKAE